MALTGRRMGIRSIERKPLQLYVVPRSHLLVRLMAEHEGTTIGRFMDQLIAEAADERGISLGTAT